jgi:hypothetical protein
MLADRCLEPARGHTGLAALRWFEANVPKNSVVLDDHEILPLRPNEARCAWAVGVLMNEPGSQAWTYIQRWKFRLRAAVETFRPVYDVIVLDAPWQGETFDEVELHRRTYDKTWPNGFVSGPASLAPVARYTSPPPEARAILETRPETRATVEAVWPAFEWLLDGRPVEWLVSSEVSYNNYATDTAAHRKKRERFPDRAAFYDDLKAHYDCWQWSPSPGGLTGPTIRVYDLRKRVSDNPKVTEMGLQRR